MLNEVVRRANDKMVSALKEIKYLTCIYRKKPKIDV
jgi:hypothetical protein